ncbi:hypothetical protein ACFPRL_23930 [Pseudoclavibacter helvolus]
MSRRTCFCSEASASESASWMGASAIRAPCVSCVWVWMRILGTTNAAQNRTPPSLVHIAPPREPARANSGPRVRRTRCRSPLGSSCR